MLSNAERVMKIEEKCWVLNAEILKALRSGGIDSYLNPFRNKGWVVVYIPIHYYIFILN